MDLHKHVYRISWYNMESLARWSVLILAWDVLPSGKLYQLLFNSTWKILILPFLLTGHFSSFKLLKKKPKLYFLYLLFYLTLITFSSYLYWSRLLISILVNYIEHKWRVTTESTKLFRIVDSHTFHFWKYHINSFVF